MPAGKGIRASLLSIAVGVVVACLLGACGMRTGAPDGWLPHAEDTGTDVHGAWTQAYHENPEAPGHGSSKPHWDVGELIAVGNDTIYVQTLGAVIAIPADEVRDLHVAWYESDRSTATGLTVMGAVSTLSHGYLLVVTLPAWLIVGGGASVVEAEAPFVEIEKGDVQSLAPYARFPAGLPPGFDTTTLLAKPGATYLDYTNSRMPVEPEEEEEEAEPSSPWKVIVAFAVVATLGVYLLLR